MVDKTLPVCYSHKQIRRTNIQKLNRIEIFKPKISEYKKRGTRLYL